MLLIKEAILAVTLTHRFSVSVHVQLFIVQGTLLTTQQKEFCSKLLTDNSEQHKNPAATQKRGRGNGIWNNQQNRS